MGRYGPMGWVGCSNELSNKMSSWKIEAKVTFLAEKRDLVFGSKTMDQIAR